MFFYNIRVGFKFILIKLAGYFILLKIFTVYNFERKN